MFKWIIKKFIIGQLNKLIDKYQDNINKVKDTLQIWISRLEKIIGCLKSLMTKLDDNQLDSEEVDETVSEIEIVIKEW